LSVDFKSLSDVLRHPMRRKIVLMLCERGNVSYVELMKLVGATNTGKFNYHLKVLGDLIEKNQDGEYGLTEKGRLAAQFVQKFPEREPQQMPLRMADGLLIGFAGTVLTVVNPGFWGSFLLALTRLELDPAAFLVSLGLLSFVYALVVPGAVMWFLTVRRAHSHDPYDLFKPPFVAFILLLLLLVVMFLLKVNLTITIKSPETPGPHGGILYSFMQISLLSLLFFGLMFSFVGVAVAEFVSKMKKKLAS